MLIKVYTDGSCFGNPGPGGWGAIFVSNKGLEKMSGSDKYTTNNKMELFAVIKAIKKIKKDSTHKNNTYEIYSDSAYVINAITKGWLEKWKTNGWKTSDGKDVKNKELWIEFNSLLMSLKVKPQFIKVKGHSGNQYNEYVDKLAKGEIK